MRSPLHQYNVKGCGITALTILDGVPETIVELFQSPKQVGFHKADHGIVCRETETYTIKLQYTKAVNDTHDWDAVA